MSALLRACCCFAAFALSPVAGAAEPGSELALRPWVDGPLTLATLSYTLVTFVDEPTPWVEQGLPEEPALPFDRPFAGGGLEGREGAALASDILGLYPSFAMPVAMGVIGGVRGAEDGRALGQAGTWFVLGTQAVSINASLTHVVKHAVRRPRPYTYDDGWRAELQAELDAGAYVEADHQLSFYSGHSSAAGAWSFALAHAVAVTSEGSTAARALPYLLATGVTATTGALRVRAHKHFPSDVLVGGLAGAAVGILVVEAHRGERAIQTTAGTLDEVPTLGFTALW